MSLKFKAVFKEELAAVNFRRKRLQEPSPEASLRSEKGFAGPEGVRPRTSRYHVPRPPVHLSEEDAEDGAYQTMHLRRESDDLTGLAFSGGGIRSAAFCLGVSQALDSLASKDEPRVFDAFDYLSTVSGGGYIGTSIVAGMMQSPYDFPFASKLDSEETSETKHLRNYSNFLVPNGVVDYLTSVALLLRGLLVNALIVLPFLLLLAAATVAFNPHSTDLGKPDIFGVPLSRIHLPYVTVKGFEAFTLTINVTFLVLALMFLSAIFTARTFETSRLRSREWLAWGLGVLVAAIAIVFVLDLQPLILGGMFGGGERGAAEVTALADGSVKSVLMAVAHAVPALATALLPAVVVLIGFAQKLANIARAALGEATWQATLKKYASRIVLYLSAVVVPMLLWITYLYLSFWAIRPEMGGGFYGPPQPVAPYWLAKIAAEFTTLFPAWLWSSSGVRWIGAAAALYLVVAVVLLLVCLFIGPNSNSLNQLYRDRLSRAFLFQRDRLREDKPAEAVDRWKFSSLKRFADKGSERVWDDGAAYSPFLLVNTAINLIASENLNKRGRNADNFTFSPLHIGSQATGYAATRRMEAAVPSLGLATAMATSGAAASANMGSHTVRILTFSLSLLNIRLGYWLANPAKLEELKHPLAKHRSEVGTFYFAMESAGLLNEKRLNVYLTDGGHIENLGIYELLRRRCRVVLAVDAEADPSLTFESFVRLQVLARIDLGIRIDMPWQDIQKRSLEVGRELAASPSMAPKRRGPHAAIGIIHYSETEHGVLFYVKSSLTGDENDYILDYKRRNPTFPHETTLDQFFSEEQFEVYRALGFHAAQHFFNGSDDFARPATAPAGWGNDVVAALALLNVPAPMRSAFGARLRENAAP